VLKLMLVEDQTHPFAVIRARELRRWVDSGEYTQVLAGNYPRREDDSTASLTDSAREAARSYADSFSSTQDALGRFVHETAGALGGLKGWFDENFRR
jgi:hypothetical protein